MTRTNMHWKLGKCAWRNLNTKKICEVLAKWTTPCVQTFPRRRKPLERFTLALLIDAFPFVSAKPDASPSDWRRSKDQSNKIATLMNRRTIITLRHQHTPRFSALHRFPS